MCVDMKEKAGPAFAVQWGCRLAWTDNDEIIGLFLHS